MGNSFFIDTTLCTACRGCQVACKQWHGLPAESTRNRGSYQNPADLSFDTYKLVYMREEVIGGRLEWLFFPDQCRHCIEAPCQEAAGEPEAIFTDPATGAVLYTDQTRQLAAEDIIDACPYNIPRKGPDGRLAKCNMCIDRVREGLLPVCVKTCPTGAMNFGSREEMLALAKQRFARAKKTHPAAQLLNPADVRVIYLTAYDPLRYHGYAVAADRNFDMTRHVALRRLFRPLERFTAQL